MEILGQIGISKCSFLNFCNTSRQLPRLKVPALLKEITFHGFINPVCFESIMSPGLTALQKLKLDHSALYHLDFFDIDLNLPKLDILEIVDHCSFSGMNGGHVGYSELSVFYTKYWIVLNNTTQLFAKTFPGLTQLIVTLPFVDSMDSVITSGLLRVLTNQAESLKSVQITLGRNRRINRSNNGNNPNLTPLPISILKMIPQKRNTTLEKLSLDFPIKENIQNLSEWEYWLNSLSNLNYCLLKGCFSQNCFESVTTQNEATLETMKLTWLYYKREEEPDEDGTVTPMNCTMFKNCNKLTYLRLVGDWHAFMRTRISPVGLMNTEDLPKSLVHLAILSIPVDSKSCRGLALQFPALETLKLINIAGRLGFGLQIQDLEETTKEKKLKAYKVDIGLGDGGVNAYPNSFHLCTGSRHTNFSVAALLGTDGNYRSMEEDDSIWDDEDDPDVEHINYQFIGED